MNYLHHHDSLERLLELEFDTIKQLRNKKKLKKELVDVYGFDRGFVTELLRCYESRYDTFLQSLECDVRHTQRCKQMFHQLGCRGFSYKFNSQLKLKWPKVRDNIGFAMGLTSSQELYYPNRVRNDLERAKLGHWGNGRYPSIGFALGQVTDEGWFISVLQSDLMFSESSVIKDHFRGWRKLLMNKIIDEAEVEAERLFLCSAETVLKTCKAKSRPQEVPKSWRTIYDLTAADFGMSRVRLNKSVDVQCFSGEQPVYENEFYVMDL